MIPLLANKGKVVTLGSNAGPMSFKKITNEELKQRWQKKAILKDDIIKLVQEF